MYNNGNGKINQGDTNCGLYLAKLVLYTLIQKLVQFLKLIWMHDRVNKTGTFYQPKVPWVN